MAAHYRAARAGGGEKVTRSWAGGSGTKSLSSLKNPLFLRPTALAPTRDHHLS